MIGVFTFGWIIVALYRENYRLYRFSEDGMYRGLALGMIAGLTGLLVHAVGANTFIIVRIMEPFWLTAGLVVCLGKTGRGTSQRGGSCLKTVTSTVSALAVGCCT